MRHLATVRRLPLVLALVLATAVLAAAQTQQYTVVDLGVLAGETTAGASDINNQLQIVGTSGGRPFLWEAARGMQPLGDFGGVGILSLHINEGGTVVGCRPVDGVSRPFQWRAGGVSELPAPAGPVDIYEFTDGGLVLYRLSEPYRSVVLSGGRLFDLGEVLSLDPIFVTGINDQLMLGGNGDGEPLLRLADGRLVDPTPPLPPGPGPLWADRESRLDAIGPAGHFIGTVGRAFANFRWEVTTYVGDASGRARALPVIPGASDASFNAVNRHGDAVGAAYYPRPAPARAIAYSGGQLIDLTSVVSPGWGITYAAGINDAGYIVGWGKFNGGENRAVLLVPPGQPVPTPTPTPNPSPTAPAAPANLTYTLTGRTITLAWEASAGATDYVVEAGSAAGDADLYNSPVGATTGVSAPVGPGAYYVRVRARNAAGTSAASNEVVIVVP